MEMIKRENYLILIGLCIMVFTLAFCAPQAMAGKQETLRREGHYGGKVYAVKVYKHTCDTDATTDDTFYNIAATESGLKIFSHGDASEDRSPLWINDFPDPNDVTSYQGGAVGRGIDYLKTGLDVVRINNEDNKPTDYAFYADGATLYMLDISDVTNNIEIVDSIPIPNVRAVKVDYIPAGSSGSNMYYAFALAYQEGTPGTTSLAICKIDTGATDVLSSFGAINLDKDSTNPNNEGGCALDFIGDFDNDGTREDPYLFIADGTEGIKAVNLANLYASSPSLPTTSNLTDIDTTGTALGIDVVRFGDNVYAFVADGDDGLKVYDVTTPSSMSTNDTLTGSLAFSYETGYSGKAYDVKLFGTTAFIANGKNGVQIADVSDPNNPVDITLSKYNGSGARMTYIDSDLSADRFQGTAYGLDFDVSSDGNTWKEKAYPIIAWGEAGLVKMKAEIEEVDKDALARIVDMVSDGTYVWILRNDGKLSRITPGSSMTITTTTNKVFSDATCDFHNWWGEHTIGNIVSCGDYIYGVDDQSMDKIARVKKTGFSTSSTSQASYSQASDFSDDFHLGSAYIQNFILRLFTNGTNVFFVDYDISGDGATTTSNNVLHYNQQGEIGRLDLSKFAAEADMIETNARIFDVSADPRASRIVVTNDYIYGIRYGHNKYGDGSGDCLVQIPTSFAATSTAIVDDTHGGRNWPDIVNLVTDGTNVCAVDQSGDLLLLKTTNWSSTSIDVIRNDENHFITPSITAGYSHPVGRTIPIFIQGNYVYGRKYDATGCLSRVQIAGFPGTTTFGRDTSADYANFTIRAPENADPPGQLTGAVADEIIYITGDGQDIYVMRDETGDIYKVAIDRFGTSDDMTADAIRSKASYFRWMDDDVDDSYDSTVDCGKIVFCKGYIFGIADDSSADLSEIGFIVDETNDKVCLKKGGNKFNDYYPYFCGDARDIVFYKNSNNDSSDDVYIADGERGIVKIQFSAPTDASSDLYPDGKVWHHIPWWVERFNDTNFDGDLVDDRDITDARGLDLFDIGTTTYLLVADGTQGVKIINPQSTVPPTTAMTFRQDGTLDQGNGYITQALMGNGTAEAIKYFQFSKLENGESSTEPHEYAAVANGEAGVVILDLDNDDEEDLGDMTTDSSDTVTPLLIDTNGYANDVAVDKDNNYLYVADGSNGLVIIDLDPNNTASFGTDNETMIPALLNGRTSIYNANSSKGTYNLRAVELNDPNNPTYAYLAYGSKGVVILKLSDYSVADVYPETGQPNGEAYDVEYDITSDTLFVAMNTGELLSLDVTDPTNIVKKGGLNTYGQALAIAYGDIDSDTTGDAPYVFIANGSGGFLAASVKTKPVVSVVLPNIQPVGGGDTIKVIGSGFKDDNTTVTITNSEGTYTVPANQVTVNSSFELTFTAPISPSGLPGQFILQVNRSDLNTNGYLTNAIEYLPAEMPLIAVSAASDGAGMAAPGAQVPLDLLLRTNGAGQVSAVTARIEYDTNLFSVSTDGSGSVLDSVFSINENLEKIVEMEITDSDLNDDIKTLTITIFSEDLGVNAEILDGTILGTVYFTVTGDSLTQTDTTRPLSNSLSVSQDQQVSTIQGDYVKAQGSSFDIYVKPAPQMTCTYNEQWKEAGADDTFGPFEVNVAEVLDASASVSGALITFTAPSNAIVDADNTTTGKCVYTVTRGTLQSSDPDGTWVTVFTDATGDAAVTLSVGTKGGEYTMTISGVYNGATLAGNPSTPLTEQFNIYAETATDAADSISLSYTPTDPTTGSAVTVTATAYDKYGNVLGPRTDSTNLEETITFITTYGTLSALSGSTNRSGQVSVTLNLENAVVAHVVTASYDTTTKASITITPAGPDVDASGAWDALLDVQKAIYYHINWTDLSDSSIPKPEGETYVPGDTDENHRMDLNEVIDIINLSLGLSS
ncbi:MAG: IPT/TIG domain-containing protein [bacterium]